MSVVARLAVFVAGLVVVFGLAYAVGQLVGPLGGPSEHHHAEAISMVIGVGR